MKLIIKGLIDSIFVVGLLLLALKSTWVLTILILFVLLPALIVGIVKHDPKFWAAQLDATRPSGVRSEVNYERACYSEEKRREAELQKEYRRKNAAKMRYNEAVTRQYNARHGSETEKAIAETEVKRRLGDLL